MVAGDANSTVVFQLVKPMSQLLPVGVREVAVGCVAYPAALAKVVAELLA